MRCAPTTNLLPTASANPTRRFGNILPNKSVCAYWRATQFRGENENVIELEDVHACGGARRFKLGFGTEQSAGDDAVHDGGSSGIRESQRGIVPFRHRRRDRSFERRC